MTPVPTDRAREAADKLQQLRDVLQQASAGAIRLRGADWFAWATAGGDAGSGNAELLVTKDEACILTDDAEGERLRREQVPAGFTYHAAPWAEPELHDKYGSTAAGEGAILSDRPRAGEAALPHAAAVRRMVLSPQEQERYRSLGRDVAEAVGRALRSARPDWTEAALAGAVASALIRRGIQPVGLRVDNATARGGPVPSQAAIGDRVTLTCTTRRDGLHAGLSRSVSFTPLTDDERNAWDALLHLEGTALDAARPGQSLGAVYHALEDAYRHADREDAIRLHRQGGVTGYAPVELPFDPTSATGLESGMAIALVPSFDAIKIEDTFLLGPSGLENLTVDPGWPTTIIQGRARPLWLEATT